jgi:hypothetical protein
MSCIALSPWLCRKTTSCHDNFGYCSRKPLIKGSNFRTVIGSTYAIESKLVYS